MTTITNDLKVMGVIVGPVWKDCCAHSPADYVATFEYSDRTGPEGSKQWFTQTIDMYIIKCDGDYGQQSLCLRFGNDPSDYYSGPLHICWTIAGLPYTAAREILLHFGKLQWVRDKPAVSTGNQED